MNDEPQVDREAEAKPETASAQRFVRSRLIVSLLVGLTMVAITFQVGWFNAVPYEYMSSYDTAGDLALCLQDYVDQTDHLPKHLSDIPKLVDRFGEPDKKCVDYWGRPYQIVLQSGQVDVISLGKDGQAGGKGLDADIHSSQDFDDVNHKLTLSQYMHRPEYGNAVFVSIASGMLTALVAFFAAAKAKSLSASVAVTVVSGLLAVFVGTIIAALHILMAGH